MYIYTLYIEWVKFLTPPKNKSLPRWEVISPLLNITHKTTEQFQFYLEQETEEGRMSCLLNTFQYYKESHMFNSYFYN